MRIVSVVIHGESKRVHALHKRRQAEMTEAVAASRSATQQVVRSTVVGIE